ncbi:MAG: helicase [Oscillatoriales cyanobacterium]|uniref:Helicase-related protein n=1 Tax=Microcoleus anatoxicus PTRS2 TaxID=2705321 RepID=A0ABU8YTS5_9CYAN|nr:MAG: helicase [Oscillatoriales cyanobacterium]TAE02967.1 MAG: helicase [Oscillatoriales cyanobacterium]TAE99288.1 MAG: helicase [Oscillatoriales cyanobacterium]TAF68652.1 MAG: helicase [Oscillatoriales cyanobacterium]
MEHNKKRLSWFEPGKSLLNITEQLEKAKQKIRIATGFFTIKGWNLIRRYTTSKKTYLLVGLDDPGEQRARMALIQEIMRDLRTGLDVDRRKSVRDLVKKIQSNQFEIVDARAKDHHNKLYIYDEIAAIQTSSNLTGKGLMEQVEGGNIINEKSEVMALIQEFDNYFNNAHDLTQDLLEILLKWLDFATPWDIYLKTILALEQIKPVKTTYSKKPLIYQQDMISLTLSQIYEHGGSMLVASTGLGKTVMGTLIAVQLKSEDFIDKVIIICPMPVKASWRKEMRDASISADFFTLETLDKEDSNKASDLDIWEDFIKDICSGKGRYLLIFDESHKLRKRYPDQFGNKYSKIERRRERKAFTRINKVVNEFGNSERVKVLLLTGSPYATDIENINVQLHLLPHTAESYVLFPQFFDDAYAWKIEESSQFTQLPVAHQLTTPHVAKYYGQSDEKGRYINFGEQKKYFPDVLLFTLSFPVILESELTSVITQGYFDLNIPNAIYRKNIVTLIKKAWASSPLALKESLESVVDTPEGEKSFNLEKSEFVISQQERQKVLNPIISKLHKLKPQQDKKLQNLLKIIDFHCPQEKLVIFCERYPTASYLEEAIKFLKPSLRIFSTIEKNKDNKYQPKTLKNVEKAIEKFAPIANNTSPNGEDTYDVFITTDNYGIGVNMQDASVVINYDIAWTPIEPIQRAGRILRLWDDFRTVRIYTFIPILTETTELQDEFVDIGKRWDKLMERHEESRKLTDLPVLTSDNNQLINMPDFASGTKVEKGILNLQQADDKDVSLYYQHTRKLHSYRDYAETLESDLVSALNYSGESILIYILLKHKDDYKILLYDQQKSNLRSPSPEYILNLIECTPETEVALVEADILEELADIVIRKWCQQNQIYEEEVSRECTLYLKPKDSENSLKKLLRYERPDESEGAD